MIQDFIDNTIKSLTIGPEPIFWGWYFGYSSTAEHFRNAYVWQHSVHQCLKKPKINLLACKFRRQFFHKAKTLKVYAEFMVSAFASLKRCLAPKVVDRFWASVFWPPQVKMFFDKNKQFPLKGVFNFLIVECQKDRRSNPESFQNIKLSENKLFFN